MERADIIVGLFQVKTCEPACCTAKTRILELLRRVTPPMKSILMNASHEKTFAAFSRGQKLVTTRMATKPNGMLKPIISTLLPAKFKMCDTYFILNSHRQSDN